MIRLRGTRGKLKKKLPRLSGEIIGLRNLADGVRLRCYRCRLRVDGFQVCTRASSGNVATGIALYPRQVARRELQVALPP